MEVDRAEPDPVRLRLPEPRLIRKIGSAPDDVHGQSGDPELLAAGAIKLHELGDGRHLPQEANIVEAPQFYAAGGPLRVSRPTDLTFNLRDELSVR